MKKYLFSLIILLFFISTNFLTSQDLKDADYYYTNAKELFRISKYNEALEIINEGLSLYKTNLKLNLAKTMTFLAMEKYEDFYNQMNIL